MRLVYVCAPFAGDPEGNTKRAKAYARLEMIAGNASIVPHLNFAYCDEATERAACLEMCVEAVGRCDELHAYGDTISAGMKLEIAEADRQGIKVVYIPTDLSSTMIDVLAKFPEDLSLVDLARKVFDTYAAMDHPDLPLHPISKLQVELYRWQARQPFDSNEEAMSLGVGEELGELAEAVLEMAGASGRILHATLKSRQKIRGMDHRDTYRAKVADGVADLWVFSLQLLTMLRLDGGALVEGVARRVVMVRDWSLNQASGG